MRKPVFILITFGVILSLLVFVFFTTYYFVGTQRSEQANRTQCHCHHLSNETKTNETQGSEVDADDLRYTVSFFNKLKTKRSDIIYSHFCSGVLLNPTMILTSYHCFNPSIRPSNQSEDLVGIAPKHDLYNMFTTESSHRRIVKVHFPDQSGVSANPEADLAIVQIDNPFNPNDSDVSFACLINQNIGSIGDSIKYFSSGYGFEKRMLELSKERESLIINSKEEWQFNLKQPEYRLQIMPLEEKQCKQSNLTSLICASSKNSSTCIGDTAISLLYELETKVYVVGISGSLKDKRSSCQDGEFTSIFPYLTWIDQITEGEICPPPVRILGGFNEFVTQVGIAYFVGSAILLVLLTYLVWRKSMERNKPEEEQKADEADAANAEQEVTPS